MKMRCPSMVGSVGLPRVAWCSRVNIVAPLTLAWAISLCLPATAQEEIFSDDFEWASICAWSNPWFPDFDADSWGDRAAAGIQVNCPAPGEYVPIRGDCDDTDEFINPAAFEVPGSGVDENCDDQIDESFATCDAGLPSNENNPDSYAAAMDLCQNTSATAPGLGLVEASLSFPDGTGTPSSVSRAIRPDFGAVTPRRGSSMAVFSTGTAAATGDTNPAHVPFQPGSDTGTSSGLPGDWVAANGGTVPNAPGCPPPFGGAAAFNPVMLHLDIKVPSNARSFSVNSNFFSAEFPEWVCSPFNDFYVVLLDSTYAGDPPNPSDKNLARYTDPSDVEYPIGTNLAFGDTGLFTQCVNGPTGCTADSVDGTISTCVGVADLAGTGMDVVNPPTGVGTEPGWCGASNLAGGATGWLVTRGNVVPGEVITLRLAIWDTGDGVYDSVVLIDNFQWSVEASDPGTIID